MTNEINFIDLFAGAGGLSEGFKRENFNPIAFIEKNVDSCCTLKTRLAYYYLKKNKNLDYYYKYLKKEINRDIFYSVIPKKLILKVINEEINEEKIKNIFNLIDAILGNDKVHIVIGGPPCQTYSIIGRNRIGSDVIFDKRNYLYQFYIMFLAKYKPLLFLFENVPGLMSANNSKYFKDILIRFEKEGYKIKFSILNASDYGILQNRKRIFIVGYKNGIKFDFPKPDETIKNSFKLKDIFIDLPELKASDVKEIVYYTADSTKYLKLSVIRNNEIFTSQHITRPLNDIDKEIYKIAIKKFLSTGKQLKYYELPKELQKHKNLTTFVYRFKVLNLEGLSHTIVAHLAKDGHSFIYPNYENPRSISVREAARIQSFPDNFYFEGSMTSCFQQIGNAVPPLLSQKLAKKVKEVL